MSGIYELGKKRGHHSGGSCCSPTMTQPLSSLCVGFHPSIHPSICGSPTFFRPLLQAQMLTRSLGLLLRIVRARRRRRRMHAERTSAAEIIQRLVRYHLSNVQAAMRNVALTLMKQTRAARCLQTCWKRFKVSRRVGRRACARLRRQLRVLGHGRIGRLGEPRFLEAWQGELLQRTIMPMTSAPPLGFTIEAAAVVVERASKSSSSSSSSSSI